MNKKATYAFEGYMFNVPLPERTFDVELEAVRLFNTAQLLGIVVDRGVNIELADDAAPNDNGG